MLSLYTLPTPHTVQRKYVNKIRLDFVLCSYGMDPNLEIDIEEED